MCRSRTTKSAPHLTLSNGGASQSGRFVVFNAGQRARNLVRAQGGYVPQALDKIAGQVTGVALAKTVETLVVPMRDAGIATTTIREFGADLMDRIISNLLRDRSHSA